MYIYDWSGVSYGKRHRRVIALYLEIKGLEGSLSPHVGNLSFLHELSLSNNSFQRTIPHEFRRMNKLTGGIPPFLGNLTTMESFSTARNQLSGNIPDTLGKIPLFLEHFQLEYMNLSFNNFEGEVPVREVFANASAFSVSGNSRLCGGMNKLTGGIPPFLGNLTTMESFSTARNQLSGNIPDTLGMNKLTGGIPPFLGNLTTMESFSTTRNQLSGNIPDTLGKIPPFLEHFQLEYMNLSFNNFEGEVPVKGVFANASAFSVSGNSRLCRANLIRKGGVSSVYKGIIHNDDDSYVAVKMLEIFVSDLYADLSTPYQETFDNKLFFVSDLLLSLAVQLTVSDVVPWETDDESVKGSMSNTCLSSLVLSMSNTFLEECFLDGDLALGAGDLRVVTLRAWVYAVVMTSIGMLDNVAKNDDIKCWPGNCRTTKRKDGGKTGRGGGRTRGRSGDMGNGDQCSNLRNGRNQNGDAINDNILGDVRNVIENNDHWGCTYKEFLACNLKEYHELARLVPHLVTPKNKSIKRYMYGLALHIRGMMAAMKPMTIQKAVQIAGTLTVEAIRNRSIKKNLEKRENRGEPNMDRNRRDDNKRTRTGNDFATTTNPVRRENTGATPKCTTYYRVVPRNVNPINAKNLAVAHGACFKCRGIDHYKSACPRLNRAQGPRVNGPNQTFAINGGQGPGNKDNQARGREFMLGVEKAHQDPNIMTGFSYETEIASGQLVEINKIIKGCKLEIDEKARHLMSAKAKEHKQEEMVVVREFPEVFPNDLSGLPSVREIEFWIEFVLGAISVMKSPYRVASSEMEELLGQLKELQDKGFIQPSSSH
nr:cGMP-dependent kinase [Tanacetum cinerariifolium]